MLSRSESVLIVCNGLLNNADFLRKEVDASHFCIAADGGAEILRRYGLTPDIIIGDLDSISEETLKFFSTSEVIRKPSQYACDLEKALDWVKASEYLRASIVGMDGGRIDFTLANFSVLWNYVLDIDLVVKGDGWKAFPVTSSFSYSAPKGSRVSLIPFGVCEGIRLKGLKYPLEDADMQVGQMGVSNEVVENEFSLELEKGCMLTIVYE